MKLKPLVRNTWLQAFGVVAITSGVLTVQSLATLTKDVNAWRGAHTVYPPAASRAPSGSSANAATPQVLPPALVANANTAANLTPPPPRATPTAIPRQPAAHPADPSVPTVQGPISAGGVDEFQAGMGFYDGVGVAKDFRRAVDSFERSASAGNGASMAKLGWMYWFGEGVDPDATRGAEWFRRGAKAGNPEAQYWLATFYEKGYGGVKKDDRQALELLRRSAAQGFAKAVTALRARGEQLP